MSTLVPTLLPLVTPPMALVEKAGSAVTATRVPFGTRPLPEIVMLLNVTVVEILPFANKLGGLTRTLAVDGRVPVPEANAVVKLEFEELLKGFPTTSLMSVVTEMLYVHPAKREYIGTNSTTVSPPAKLNVPGTAILPYPLK